MRFSPRIETAYSVVGVPCARDAAPAGNNKRSVSNTQDPRAERVLVSDLLRVASNLANRFVSLNAIVFMKKNAIKITKLFENAN